MELMNRVNFGSAVGLTMHASQINEVIAEPIDEIKTLLDVALQRSRELKITFDEMPRSIDEVRTLFSHQDTRQGTVWTDICQRKLLKDLKCIVEETFHHVRGRRS